ncbi:MAG TPA: aspartyl protease family protein [Puia sp.]|nr:aspartyl protease family protein [Puia sp.]
MDKNCSPKASERLFSLLRNKEYFLLEKEANQFRGCIGPGQQLYFQSHLDNAFNRNQKALEDCQELLRNYSSSLPDSLKADLCLLQGDSYFKEFQYAKAAAQDSLLLANYSRSLDIDQLKDIKNEQLIRNGLRNAPPQQTMIRSESTIAYTKNQIGILDIPVEINSVASHAIFDTRANISCISETYAKRFGMKKLDVSYEEGSGITGIRFQTGLAVADSVKLGNVLVRHAVFQVMPDSVLYIAPIGFSMNIIVGFPIIEQLREVQIFKDGRLFVPVQPSGGNLHNLALDGLNPVISLKHDHEMQSYYFDLGASTSILYYLFFVENRSAIVSHGVSRSTDYGGAGGIIKKESFVLPSASFQLGNRKISIDSVDVLTQKINPGEKFYGNIGEDFVGQFNELIINFRDMYVEGR